MCPKGKVLVVVGTGKPGKEEREATPLRASSLVGKMVKHTKRRSKAGSHRRKSPGLGGASPDL